MNKIISIGLVLIVTFTATLQALDNRTIDAANNAVLEAQKELNSAYIHGKLNDHTQINDARNKLEKAEETYNKLATQTKAAAKKGKNKNEYETVKKKLADQVLKQAKANVETNLEGLKIMRLLHGANSPQFLDAKKALIKANKFLEDTQGSILLNK